MDDVIRRIESSQVLKINFNTAVSVWTPCLSGGAGGTPCWQGGVGRC